MHISYSKIFPILVFIGIPAVDTILSYVINQPTFFTVPGLEYQILPIDLIYLLLFFYSFYPVRYSNDQYFKEERFKNIVVEYHYIRDILYVIAPLFILSVLLNSMLLNLIQGMLCCSGQSYESFYTFQSILYSDYLLPFGINLAYSVIGGIIWIAIFFARKDTRFYLAKEYFKTIYNVRNNLSKAKYIVIGIKSYDRYLRRNLNLQIKDVDKLCSKILISDPPIDQNVVIESMSTAFEDIDKLKPAKNLSKVLDIKKTDKFLVGLSLQTKIKDFFKLLGIVTAPIIAIIQLLMPSSH